MNEVYIIIIIYILTMKVMRTVQSAVCIIYYTTGAYENWIAIIARELARASYWTTDKIS